MSSDKRKFQKRKQREARLHQQKVAHDQEKLLTRKKNLYPSFIIGKQDADPEFIEAVLKAISETDFSNPDEFAPDFQRFLRIGKSEGFATALEVLKQLPDIQVGPRVIEGFTKMAFVISLPGSIVLSHIPVEIRKRFMPMNDVSIEYGTNDMLVNFSSMHVASGTGGRIYFGHRKPTISFDSNTYTVGFSSHAIERICERLNPRYYEYGAAGDIHAHLNACVYYEPVLLHGNQPAFAIYDICGNKGTAHYSTYTIGVFGEENIKPGAGKLYYKVGYCPVVFEGDFAKAKTLLPPGYKSTPEYGIFLNQPTRSAHLEELRKKATAGDRIELNFLYRNDAEVAKFFHDNGCPQVVQLNRRVFVYPNEKFRPMRFV